MKRVLPLLLCVTLAAVGCKSAPSARIKSTDEGDRVGIDGAGAATFQTVVAGTMEKLLANYTQSGLGRSSICVLEVDNEGVEDLGDWTEQLYQLITNSVTSSNQYTAISRRVVAEGMREAGLSQTKLLLPKYQRQFSEIMETQGNLVELLLFPKLTTGSTDAGGGVKQRDYLLTLEMIDIESGQAFTFSDKVRKEYTN